MGELYSLDGRIMDPTPFLDPYEPVVQPKLGGRCMDDRPRDTEVMEHGLQIPGGAAGEGTTFGLALEMKEPGTFLRTGVSADELSDAIAKMIGSEYHENCAARMGRPNIIGLIAAKPEIVYANARQLGDFEDTMFDRLVGAAQRVSNSGLIAVNELPKDRFAPLRKNEDGSIVPHAGRNVVAIDATRGEHVLWNTRRAWEAGIPAYGANTGMYPGRAVELNDKVGSILGHTVEEEAFSVAAIAYLASTIEHLPTFEGRAPDIVRVPAAA